MRIYLALLNGLETKIASPKRVSAAENMLDIPKFQTFVVSPHVLAILALLLFVCGGKWYLNLPPKPKFPIAELDEDDWHGSLMRAKTKVSRRKRDSIGG